MWFILSIIALICWSGSDFFSKVGSKPDDKYSHWKMVMAVGLVMGIHAGYEIFVGGTQITFSAILTYLPVSALYILSMLLGYIALRYIELSVSSPVCNSSGALVAILYFFLFKQEMAQLQIFGVAMVCVGVVGLGFVEMYEDDEVRALRQKTANVKYTKSLIALLLPILYCVLDAAGTFADSIVLETLDEDVANVAYELTFLFMGIISAIYVLVIKRDKLTFSREIPKLTGGVFETAGQFAYIYAIGDAAHVAFSAPIISAYCALSVIWSRIFLKEKLSWKHYAMIFITIAGIVILGIFDA